MGTKIWMIAVQFVILFIATRSFLVRPLYGCWRNRSPHKISDSSYFRRETDFLGILLQAMVSEKGNSQITLTDKTLQSFLTWIVGRVKRKLPQKEPLQNNFSRNISFVDTSLNFEGNFENITIDRLSTLQQNYLKASAKNSTVEFGYRIPQIETRRTAYELDGQLYGYNLYGKGFINVNVTGLEINGTSKYSLNRWKHKARIHFKQMKLNYWFDEIQIKITGLEVPAIIADTINPLLSSIMTRYLQDQEEYLSPKVSETTRVALNKRFKESNLSRLVKFVWEWII